MATSSTVGVIAVVLMVGLGMGEEAIRVDRPVARGAAPAAEGVPKPAPRKCKDLWLGIEVSKAEPAVHAQLEDVPAGVGFVIDAVVPGSPAAEAGIRDYDFVWKMDDQLLVNLAQFWTLLNMREAGDRVALTLQRGGRNETVEVELRVRPAEHRGQERADHRIMAPAIPGLPVQIHDLLGRVAELRDGKGTVRIWRQGDAFAWAEYDEFDLELRSGTLRDLSEDAFPPDLDEELKRKLEALVRGYEQAERNQRVPRHEPRVRRVPDPAGD